MLAPLLALAMMTQAAPEMDRGSHLFQKCQALIRFQDNVEKATPADTSDAMFCVGYLDGFMQTMDLVRPNTVCEKNATVGTVARVYVAYMTAHPKELDVEMAVGLFESAFEAYPCAVPAKKPS